jgi:ubiquinone biosynthesis protein
MIDLLRGLLEAVEIVPGSYIRYRPLVIDGLLFFLERLPSARMDEIFSDQAALPASSTEDDRLISLLRACPTLHKLGQVMSHEGGLDLELRTRLQTLEMLPPHSDMNDVREIIARELGERMSEVTLAGGILAEGSVAAVVPFERTVDGVVERGVFKILKPRAEERLSEELEIWPAVGDYLEERSAHYGLPALDFRATLDGVAMLLRDEIRLDLEQKNLVRARAFYASSNRVVIPRLLDLSTPKLTAMERIDGRKVTDPTLPARVKRRLAATMVEELIARPFWSRSDAALFHADPHAGNLFATDDGRLAVLDWALVTELLDSERASVVRAMLGAFALDENETRRAMETLGYVADPGALATIVSESLRGVRHGALPAFEWVVSVLDRLARSGAIHFPQGTTLFRKSLLTLSGVIRDVSPKTSLDNVLIGTGARQFFREFGSRTFAPTRSRSFGTHVSNADLVAAFTALQYAPAKFILDTLADAVGPKTPDRYGAV